VKIIPFPSANLPSETAETPTDTHVQAFEEACFTAYRNFGTSRGLTASYLNKCVDAVRLLMRWSGKSLTALTAPDYEQWTTHLANARQLRMSTQRTYQKGVRQVFGYLVKRADLQNDAVRLFGKRIELIAHPENSIVHVIQDETAGRRPPLSHDEIERLFQAIETAIDLAELESPRGLRGLLRDYAVIYTGYIYGLRVSELASLTPDDWRLSPEVPELGRYAQLHVRFGKGARGSGKRSRIIPTTHAGFPEFIEWYLLKVRPLYKADCKDDEPLFFNERGRQISACSIEKSFKRLIIMAGLDPNRFSPHSLRRSMCQHEMMRAPSDLARNKAGHTSDATTLLYGQVPAEYYRRHQARLVRAQLRELSDRRKGG
jgi:site-specific recombinase XerD